MIFKRDTIYTYGDGRPIEGRPDPLPENPTAEERRDHRRAWWEYEDRVRDVASRAFADQFRKAAR